jgi:long-subunit fatty acid transport protein
MRKLLIFIVAIFITGSLLAGGLVTNTNQSAMYTRLQSRNASTNIDAVYYNPAGLTRLGDGLFASINNQTISQEKTIISNYDFLSPTPKEYIGKVSAPFFPGVYVAYNTGKLSLSAGFNPVGGGGGAKYDKGLPSFEMNVADIVPGLAMKGIPTTQYSSDIFFEGSSVYFGYQANIGYKINDMLSIAAGVRLVSATNTYKGHLRNISINPNYPKFGVGYTGGMVLASDFFTSGATTLNTLAAGSTAYVAGLQPIVDADLGSTPLIDGGTSVGLTQTDVATISLLLGAAGLTPAQIGGITIVQAQGTLAAAAPVFSENAGLMSDNADATQNIEVDAEESGTGYTPILSVNFTPSEKLNIAVKYEFKTDLELNTKVNNYKSGGIFSEGEKVIADMPAMFAIGVDFKPTDKLLISGSMNYYFDKNVDYDGSEVPPHIDMIDKNFTEYALGIQYSLTEKLRASAGWLGTFTGVNSNYQNAQNYDLNTNSFGGGIGYRITQMIDLNLGGQYTFYKEGTNEFTRNTIPITETYDKTTWVVAVGLDFSFGRTK